MSNNIYKLDNLTGTASNCISTGTSSGSISGILNGSTTTACIYTAPTITYGYPYYYSYPVPQTQSYDIQLRKVENGWVMLKDGKEYILKSLEDITKYTKESK